jgi:hypothetical protein
VLGCNVLQGGLDHRISRIVDREVNAVDEVPAVARIAHDGLGPLMRLGEPFGPSDGRVDGLLVLGVGSRGEGRLPRDVEIQQEPPAVNNVLVPRRSPRPAATHQVVPRRVRYGGIDAIHHQVDAVRLQPAVAFDDALDGRVEMAEVLGGNAAGVFRDGADLEWIVRLGEQLQGLPNGGLTHFE